MAADYVEASMAVVYALLQFEHLCLNVLKQKSVFQTKTFFWSCPVHSTLVIHTFIPDSLGPPQPVANKADAVHFSYALKASKKNPRRRFFADPTGPTKQQLHFDGSGIQRDVQHREETQSY